jgi:hypothetical protein
MELQVIETRHGKKQSVEYFYEYTSVSGVGVFLGQGNVTIVVNLDEQFYTIVPMGNGEASPLQLFILDVKA